MLYKEIIEYIENVKPLLPEISDYRKMVLNRISDFILQKKRNGEKAELIFICTHNSRRSHFGQIWGQAFASFYKLDHVLTYSGGTEATAFNPNAIKAIQEAGFKVIKSAESNQSLNPVYDVFYGEGAKVVAFSKKYDDPTNPTKGFCAIMTCNDADEHCPVIKGAALKIATPYLDPKKFDNIPQQEEKYSERCRQIASELFYMYSQVGK